MSSNNLKGLLHIKGVHQWGIKDLYAYICMHVHMYTEHAKVHHQDQSAAMPQMATGKAKSSIFFFFFFFLNILIVVIKSRGDLKPSYLYWKHQKVSDEL